MDTERLTAHDVGAQSYDVAVGRTELHEASHSAVALALGWSLDGVTVVGGTASNGYCRLRCPPVPESVGTFDTTTPFIAWPGDARRFTETRALTLMAGHIGALELAPREAGRYSPPLHDQAVTLAAELAAKPSSEVAAVLREVPAEPSPEVAAGLRSAVDVPAVSDEQQIARLAWVAHGSDWAAMGAWLAYLEAECRALVRRHARRICLLAEVLGERGMIDGPAARAVLESVPW